MGNERVIGLGMPLRCPQCGGDLERVGADQEGQPLSHWKCKNGHLLTLSLLNAPGHFVFFLALRQEPESHINERRTWQLRRETDRS
jgi:hypothetical protein